MWAECLAGCAVLALLTYAGVALQANLTTISFAYLLLVMGVALYGGFWQASLVSLLAAGCLDFFFTQPPFHFYMTDPKEMVALGAFELTTIVISRLSAKELRSAKEAAIHRCEMEQLYELSRSSLLLDLRQPPGPQLAILMHRVFDLRAVALYDMNSSRQDRMGEWDAGEEDLARECYLRNSSLDDSGSSTSQRVLRAGTGPVGALVVRGKLSSVVVDALASLAAIVMDRHQWFEKEERSELAKKDEQLRATVMDALAHEFKTPLTAVQTASSGLLELGGLTPPQRDLVTLIDKAAIRLNNLCTRLLKTAKLDTKHAGLETTEVKVLDLVSEVLAAHPIDAARNSVAVTVEDPSLTVRADRGLLAMILTQYVDNARKYSMARTPITVGARASRGEVIFFVRNFGSTIRLEDRERIFERFYRSQGSKDAAPGTGIGLSVARKAAEAHHGHVWVISDDKEGTTFFFSIPMEPRRTI